MTPRRRWLKPPTGRGLTRALLGSGESHILLEGGGAYRPPIISQSTGPISKIQTPFDSPVRDISKQGVKFDLYVTDDVKGHVVAMFDISGLLTGEQNFYGMDSATDICKYHFLCFVTIIQVTVISGHQARRSNKK